MLRGDVYLVDLDPSQGAEANKVRPAVLVGNTVAIRTAERNGRGVVTLVPITSNIERIYPFQVLIPAGESGLKSDSKAQAEQIRSVDYVRLHERLGSLRPNTLRKLDSALRLHLNL